MDKSFTRQMGDFSKNVSRNSSDEFKEEIDLIRSNIDNQYDILSRYLLTTECDPYARGEEYTNMILSANFKNILSLYNALELTVSGQCGASRMLFRNVYENLVISKCISISKNSSLLRKWENGDEISIGSEVFRKIKSPRSYVLSEFWRNLCCYVHGTVFSSQIDFFYENLRDEIKLNLAFIEILLCLNYHVMNSYAVSNIIKYHTKFYLDCVEDGLYEKKIKKLRNEVNFIRKGLYKDSKKIVYDFCLKWEICV